MFVVKLFGGVYKMVLTARSDILHLLYLPSWELEKFVKVLSVA